jgi:hypothetical protein
MYTNSSILLEYHPRLPIFFGMHLVNAGTAPVLKRI